MVPVRRTKIINTSRILREIWSSHGMSRVDLSRTLGLNKSTVSGIVNELLDKGLLKETYPGSSSPQGGRKPMGIKLNKEFGYILGLEIRPESWTAIAIDLDGDILFSRTHGQIFNECGLKGILLEDVKTLINELDWIGKPLMGIGVGISGIVDARNNVIMKSIPLQIEEYFDFEKEISSGFDVPVLVENDANCCAWGELAFHKKMDMRNFIFVLVEFRDIEIPEQGHEKTAVGLGIVIDGKVYYGMNYSAGEFRSVFCQEGKKGQFNIDYTGVTRIEESPAVLNNFFTDLSKNIALMVNTFNLNQVFLGGDIERYQDMARPVLQNAIDLGWPYDLPAKCEIRFSSMGEKAVAYGAGGMMLDWLFSDLEHLNFVEDEVQRKINLVYRFI